MLQRQGAGRPQISEEEIESVRMAYTRSPRKSIRRLTIPKILHSTQLQIPRFTIPKALHKNLRLYAYTVKCSYCKPLSQKISHDEKNLQ